MSERTLASIQKIVDIKEIPKADNIELAFILGWQCVVKKGEFKLGDLCVYFEVDSQLPTHQLFSFLESNKYRVKTVKRMKQLSQGLALPINILEEFGYSEEGLGTLKEGDDVTEQIGVTKHDPHPESVDPEKKVKHGVIVNYLMRYWLFRKGYFLVVPKKTKGTFPDFIPKTDEQRLQSVPSLLWRYENEWFYSTEKLDGSSATYFYNSSLDKMKFKIFPIDKGRGFGVCSRNLRLMSKDKQCWWRVALEDSMEAKVRKACETLGLSLAFQGEIIGPGIRKNKYNLNKFKFFCFGVYDITNQQYLSYKDKVLICKTVGIKVIEYEYLDLIKLKGKTVQWFVDYSNRKSFLNEKTLAEGVVVRHIENDGLSFKVINPEWLLKYKE